MRRKLMDPNVEKWSDKFIVAIGERKFVEELWRNTYLQAVLWNRNYLLRFRFRFRLTFEKLWFRFRFQLLKSYGSGSGSGSYF
jgi:hypothetical protein